MKIVNLRTSPKLNDIPNQMRMMADMIERGEVKADYGLFIIPRDAAWPEVYGWGKFLDYTSLIGLCELAKGYLVSYVVRRE